MFLWCSYCQHLIGEIPPLDRAQVSHGICEQCASKVIADDIEPSVFQARALFETLEEAVHNGDFEATGRAIDDALEAGLRPSEIMIGALHPALARVGELWEAGKISVADEHRFTQYATLVIERLRHRPPRASQAAGAAGVD